MALWVLDVVGLTRAHLGSDTPHLDALAGAGTVIDVEPALPAVTTTGQTTMLTGVDPGTHGIVGNGWYFRDLAEVWLWRQSEGLVQADPFWSRSALPVNVLKHAWWYALNSRAQSVVTPRPAYHHDGRKSPDFYAWPTTLKTALQTAHGTFPLFQFWGPGAGIASTDWLADSFVTATRLLKPDLGLCYLPHLDYDLQRFGPTGPHLAKNLRAVDAAVGRIVNEAKAVGAQVAVVSEYGISAVDHAMFPNRLLRLHGLLTVQHNATGELLDPAKSQAFAVVDHQVMHVYLNDPSQATRVRNLFAADPGVAEIYMGSERRQVGLDHPRAGDLVIFAAPGCWFAHDWWLDPLHAPDFARCVEIHKKPGYDPRELLFDAKGGKFRAMRALLKKKLGFRYVMDCIGLDTGVVRGSHGRLPPPGDRPILIAPIPGKESGAHIHQRDVARALFSLLTRPNQP